MSASSATLPEDKAPEAAPGEEKPRLPSREEEGSAPDTDPSLTVIEATHSWWPLVNFAELWQHREMLYSLTMREIMRRYKQTVLGAVWALFPVFANTALMGFFFRLFLKDTGGMDIVPYIFSGLLPWYLFGNIMSGAAHSVVEHSDLVSRIYFPRLILPLSSIGDRLLDFSIGLLILIPFLLWYGHVPGGDIILLPVIVLGLIITGLGVGLIMGAAAVAYRDVFHALALISQFWMFATPGVFYPHHQFKDHWIYPWLPLNPAFGLITNFRGCLTEFGCDYRALLISLGVGILLFLIGLFYFQRAERQFADVI